MARIRITSRFNPFTYDELVRPLEQATQYHRELEDQYTDLATKANVWENLANEQTDPIAYNTYKAYSQDLNNQAEQLAKVGLTPTSRQNLLNMRSRYSSDIVPIEQAYNRRQGLIDEQRKAMLQNPSLMFTTNFNEVSLDDLIQNPSYTYQSLSGNELYSKGQSAGKALSSRRIRDNNVRTALGGQYWYLRKEMGYSAEEALKAMQDVNQFPEIAEAINQIRESVDIDAFKDNRGRIDNYIMDGIISGLSYDVKDNYTRNLSFIPPTSSVSRGASNKKEIIPKSFLGARLITGVEGEVSDNLKLLEGLRRTGEGFSTNRLDKLLRSHKSLTDKLNEYSDDDLKKFNEIELDKTLNEKEAQNKLGTSGTRALSTAMMSSTNPNMSKYNKYKTLSKKIGDSQAEIDEEIGKIRNIIDSYSSLGNSDYDILNNFVEIERAQQKQERTEYPLELVPTDYTKVRKNLFNMLASAGKESMDSGAIGLVNKKGKTLNYDDNMKILGDPENILFKVSTGVNPQLKVVYDGEEYTIKGDSRIDRFNRDLKESNRFLKGFKDEDIKDNITEISKDDYINTMLTGSLQITTPINPRYVNIPGDSFIGMVLHPSGTNDYLKVILDNEGNFVALSSLDDEKKGGKLRDMYLQRMANIGLGGISSVLE